MAETEHTFRNRLAFTTAAEALRAESALAAELCLALAGDAAPAAAALLERYRRAASVLDVAPPLLVAGLHLLSLHGDAPDLARFLPTCGGRYEAADRRALAAAVGGALEAGQDDLLDFLLDGWFRVRDVQWGAAVRLGAHEAARRLGAAGGLALLELGAADGLLLHTPADLPVAARAGLDPDPLDLADPARRLLGEACVWPDRPDRLARFRQAAAAAAIQNHRPVLHRGDPADLLPVMTATYDAMPEHHTLLLYDCYYWASLADEEQQQAAHAVQRVAARLAPHKPLAWLQLEAAPGRSAQIRLQTFGWADQEDRTVAIIATSDRDASHIHLVG